MNDNNSIGNRIRQLRKKNKISIPEIAKLTNKDRATIYRWEKGSTENVPAQAIEKLAAFYGVSCSYLLTGDDTSEFPCNRQSTERNEVKYFDTNQWRIYNAIKQMNKTERIQAVKILETFFPNLF